MACPDYAKGWQQAVKPYRKPILSKSIWQIVNSVVPFFALWWLAYWCLSNSYSYGLTVFFAGLAGCVSVRLFIINHDCGHGSFFQSKRANDIVGFWTALFSYTPYLRWRHGHALHHASYGQIEDRGVGYFWIMGLEEYKNASKWTRLLYRLYRHPLTIFAIGGLYLFVVEFRSPHQSVNAAQTRGVWAANFILATVFGVLGWYIGYWNLFLIQFPISVVSAVLGVFLFYAQHHYEGSYWAPKETWSYERAGLEGSSYLKLDPVTQWFAGNINFHHIHHLAPKIPNYRLQEAHENIPMFNAVKPLTVWKAMTYWNLRLVDEKNCEWSDFPGPHATVSTPKPQETPPVDLPA